MDYGGNPIHKNIYYFNAQRSITILFFENKLISLINGVKTEISVSFLNETAFKFIIYTNLISKVEVFSFYLLGEGQNMAMPSTAVPLQNVSIRFLNIFIHQDM